MKKRAWSLDEVEYKTDVKSEIVNINYGTLDRNLTVPAEDVFVVNTLKVHHLVRKEVAN